jgi:hypothetical protein
MQALGPRSRAVMNDAIEGAIADGIAGTTFRYVRVNQAIQRDAHDYGRDYGWRIVITLLKDAEWLPPGVLDADESPIGRRLRPDEDVRAAEELRAILQPVFDGEALPFRRG